MTTHPTIAMIVTGPTALADYKVFVQTLEVWHPDAHLYIYTDSATPIDTIKFKGTIHSKKQLDSYAGKTRQQMEQLPGIRYTNLFTDYTYEKASVLEWAIHESGSPAGVWFLDADISLLAPLPAIPPTATLALSPHYIRPRDEALYGHYNAGFIWMRDGRFLAPWREAGKTSRFFEQVPLETIAAQATQADDGLYEFPIQVNFGWWRMFQGTASSAEIQSKFSFFRQDTSIGIRYDGVPLQSIHTHWYQRDRSITTTFNTWFNDLLTKFKSHPPIAAFKRHIAVSL